MPFSTAWIADTNLAGVPVSPYAGVFILVNATYAFLWWEVFGRRNIEGVPPPVRKFMYIRSLVTSEGWNEVCQAIAAATAS